ncbi:DUF4442 domain-containing protein [Nocardia uniformis]|uniref:DUF4442 domain-containing protein n=1 Tax=Nocardia uniformis TaxID=53432 RepID=A0A849C3W1_9NOCA|nr:DUF4442 domain-containing protein [Nocardia uniformis]
MPYGQPTIPTRWPPRRLPALIPGQSDQRVVSSSAARDRTSNRPWNRNHNGAAFGGTLFSMTDPFFGMMALGQLGNDRTVPDHASAPDSDDATWLCGPVWGAAAACAQESSRPRVGAQRSAPE